MFLASLAVLKVIKYKSMIKTLKYYKSVKPSSDGRGKIHNS